MNTIHSAVMTALLTNNYNVLVPHQINGWVVTDQSYSVVCPLDNTTMIEIAYDAVMSLAHITDRDGVGLYVTENDVILQPVKWFESFTDALSWARNNNGMLYHFSSEDFTNETV